MAEVRSDFEPAFAILDVGEFIAARAAKILAVASGKKGTWGEGRGDPYFVARQHTYFLMAFRGCKCPNHECMGCKITIGVAAKLEPAMEQLDPRACDREEAKAVAIHDRQDIEWLKDLRDITARVKRAEARRKGEQEALREDKDE